MSKHNKVNKSNYDQAGRLTPDDLARELNAKAEMRARATREERFSGKRPEQPGEPDGTRPRSAPEE